MGAGRVTTREAAPADWAAIWPFFHAIVAAQETFAYDPDLTERTHKIDYRALKRRTPPRQDTQVLGRSSSVVIHDRA